MPWEPERAGAASQTYRGIPVSFLLLLAFYQDSIHSNTENNMLPYGRALQDPDPLYVFSTFAAWQNRHRHRLLARHRSVWGGHRAPHRHLRDARRGKDQDGAEGVCRASCHPLARRIRTPLAFYPASSTTVSTFAASTHPAPAPDVPKSLSKQSNTDTDPDDDVRAIAVLTGATTIVGGQTLSHRLMRHLNRSAPGRH